jgi:hypothetical protein
MKRSPSRLCSFVLLASGDVAGGDLIGLASSPRPRAQGLAKWEDVEVASYLLIIGDREALGWILTTGRMAFPTESRQEVRALAVGDELFLYTTRGAFKSPSRHRGRIIGTAHVANPVTRLKEPVCFGERQYPVGCRIELGPIIPFGHGVEIVPLVPRLQTFDGLGKWWSIGLRRPLLRLTADDSFLLHRSLDKVEKSPEAVGTYTRWFEARQRELAP